MDSMNIIHSRGTTPTIIHYWNQLNCKLQVLESPIFQPLSLRDRTPSIDPFRKPEYIFRIRAMVFGTKKRLACRSHWPANAYRVLKQKKYNEEQDNHQHNMI